ncbi:hypothetical protein HQ520_14880, partial [bacterium]|nr:hypothetical protein [bacterium]
MLQMMETETYRQIQYGLSGPLRWGGIEPDLYVAVGGRLESLGGFDMEYV